MEGNRIPTCYWEVRRVSVMYMEEPHSLFARKHLEEKKQASGGKETYSLVHRICFCE